MKVDKGEFVALVGPSGSGKTTMLECLRDFLSYHHVEFATIFNSQLKPSEFFEMMAYDLDLRCRDTSKTEVLFALNQLLLQVANEGRTTALIIDEAHNLDWDVLEEIRLLGNLESRRGKLLQIILAGQPELDRKLDAPNLRQLKQRIVLRCTLQPFREHPDAGSIVITNPVPDNTEYLEGTAFGAGTRILFSVDGESCAAPEALSIGSGETDAAASARDYRVIRWVFEPSLAAGATGHVSFNVRLK